MRIWSIHPLYLDSKGLVALWRESLLAQAVLYGRTVGYRNHPELDRFKKHESPKGILYEYLHSIYRESLQRGYKFDWNRVLSQSIMSELPRIPVTLERIGFEWEHLSQKLQLRNPTVYKRNLSLVYQNDREPYKDVACNPVFLVVPEH